MLARSEENRRNREMHFIHQSGLEVLANGLHPASDANVFRAGCFLGSPQRFLDSFGDEVEGRAARHLDRLAPVMRKHEDRYVIRRGFAPPALTLLVEPLAADRSEHVAAEDPGAEVLDAAPSVVVIDTGRAVLPAVHGLEGSRRNEPAVERLAADTERVGRVLARTRPIAVERN